MRRPTVTRSELIVDGSDEKFRRLLYDLFALSRLLEESRTKLAKAAGVHSSQWSMLMVIAEESYREGVTVSEVAKRLELHNSFVVLHVGRLVKKGFVKRCDNHADKRSKLLKLTSKGQALFDWILPAIQAGNDMFARSADADSFIEMTNICRLLVEDRSSVLATIDVAIASLPSLNLLEISTRNSDKQEKCT